MADKITITTQDNNRYTFIPAIKTASGDFSPCEFKDSIFAEGSTCQVFLALDDKIRRYLIKQYKCGFNGNESHTTISKVMSRFNKQGDNYILNDIYNGSGYLGVEGECCDYKVFNYIEGNVLLPYKNGISIFDDANMLHSVLLDFVSFLNCLQLLHAEIDRESYLHCDIKPENAFVATISNRRVVQLIDLDSVRSVKQLIEDIENGVHCDKLVQSTARFYAREDIVALSQLRGEDLKRCIYILDTTAACKVLAELLVGNVCFNLTEQDQIALNKNEPLQIALNNFFKIGMWNDFSERFGSIEEMIQQISAVIVAISRSLPTTIQSEKLKAISNNRIINRLRDNYKKQHGLNDSTTRKSIFISDLLNDIDTGLLPCIQKTNGDNEIDETSSKMSLAMLLHEKHKYIISAQAGHGKTSSLIYEYLNNIQDLESDELYIYVPLQNYSPSKSFTDFISEESGFDFEGLLKNQASKVTLLLDAYDEIRDRYSCENQSAFDNAFLDELNKLGCVGSIIITSRFDFSISMQCKANQIGLSTAKCQPLDCNQIEKYINKIAFGAYERAKNNEIVMKLLSNALFLNIFSSLLLEHREDIFGISSEFQLLDLYFATLYEHKYGNNTSNEEDYRELLQYVGDYYCRYVERSVTFEKKASCFNAIIDFESGESDVSQITFSHLIFLDYFVSVAITCRLTTILTRKILSVGYFESMNCLDSKDLSDRTLLYVAQSLAAKQKRIFSWFRVKSTIRLEELCKVTANIAQDTVIAHNLFKLICFFGYNPKQKFYNMITKLPKNFFAHNLFISRIHIPSCIKTIEAAAFFDCPNLNMVTMSDGIQCIGESAFSRCNALTSIRLCDSIKHIEDYAFSYCSALEKINIPVNVSKLGKLIFYHCGCLSEVDYEAVSCSAITIDTFADESLRYEANSIIEDLERSTSAMNILLGKEWNSSSAKSVFWGCDRLAKVNIKSSARNIDSLFFANCQSLSIVNIENGLEVISEYAFEHCTNLTQIVIPDSVIKIEEGAFWHCERLTKIYLGAGLERIYDKVFAYCPIESISVSSSNDRYESYNNNCLVDQGVIVCGNGIIPYNDSVRIIGSHAFMGHTNLKCIQIPNNIESIRKEAFGDCIDLNTIVIGSNISHIDETAFDKCSNLLSIKVDSDNKTFCDFSCNCIVNLPQNTLLLGCSTTNIPENENVNRIGGYAFWNRYNSHKNLIIPDNIYLIDDFAFCNCYGISNLTIGKNTQAIGVAAFLNCKNILSINFNNEQQVIIGDYAFADCAALERIFIPSGNINSSAFARCVLLKEVSFGKDVAHIVSSAFELCPSINQLNVHVDNEKYYSLKNNIIESSSKTLVLGGSNYIPINEEIDTIGAYAFSGRKNLSCIIIPDNIKWVEDYAFYGCLNIISVAYNSITKVETRAFYDCPRLTEVISNKNSDHSIFGGKFNITYHCDKSKIKKTGDFYFFAHENTPTSGSYEDASLLKVLQVYNQDEWKVKSHMRISTVLPNNHPRLVSCKDSILSDILILPHDYDGEKYMIDDYAFAGLSQAKNKFLRKVLIEEGVIRIGSNAFAHNTKLKFVSILSDVLVIEDFAFCECSQLENIIFNNTLKVIGAGAFYGCWKLSKILIPHSMVLLGATAFWGTNIKEIKYTGTTDQWRDLYTTSSQWWTGQSLGINYPIAVECANGTLYYSSL